MEYNPDIESLVRQLTDFNTEVQVQDLLKAVLTEPMPTEERLRQIERALETFKEFGVLGRDDGQDLHLLFNLGHTYERLSHLEKAQEIYQTALPIAERIKDEGSRAALLNRMGKVLSRWNRWKEALDHLDRSFELYRDLGDEQGQGRSLVNKGIIFHEQGDYESASEAYQIALDLAQGVGDRKTIADSSNNMAVLASIRGDFDDAIARYQTCLTMYQEANDSLGLARTYHNLGMTHVKKRDWNAAMDSYERGYDIAQDKGLLDVMANIMLSRAELLLELGDTAIAAHCSARALDIYRKTEDHLGEGDSYRLLGRLFTLREQWTTALSLFQDSIRLNEEYSNPLGLAEAHRDMGRMFAVRGHSTEAREAYEVAVSGFQQLDAQADVGQVERLIEELSNAG